MTKVFFTEKMINDGINTTVEDVILPGGLTLSYKENHVWAVPPLGNRGSFETIEDEAVRDGVLSIENSDREAEKAEIKLTPYGIAGNSYDSQSYYFFNTEKAKELYGNEWTQQWDKLKGFLNGEWFYGSITIKLNDTVGNELASEIAYGVEVDDVSLCVEVSNRLAGLLVSKIPEILSDKINLYQTALNTFNESDLSKNI